MHPVPHLPPPLTTRAAQKAIDQAAAQTPPSSLTPEPTRSSARISARRPSLGPFKETDGQEVAADDGIKAEASPSLGRKRKVTFADVDDHDDDDDDAASQATRDTLGCFHPKSGKRRKF
jgi:hypothetical protein